MFVVLKTWMPQSIKHCEYSSFSKRESPRAFYIYSVLAVLKQEGPKVLLRMYVPRSKIVNAPKRKTQWIPSFLKAWVPKNVYMYSVLGVLKQEGRKALLRMYVLFLVLKSWMPQSAKHNEYSSFSKRDSPRAFHIYSALALIPKAGGS